MPKLIVIPKKLLIKLYYKELNSISIIASLLNLSYTCILNNFIRYNLIRRAISEANKIRKYCSKFNITKQFLIEKYIKEHRSVYKIGKLVKCSYGTITYYLKKYNIPTHRLDYPSPFKGKHHSKKSKKRLSQTHKGFLPFSTLRFEYKNIRMRSSWEVAYAKYLDKQGTKWQYESKTFDLGYTTYTPDFYLPESDTYIEIKGYWRYLSKIKFIKFKEMFRNITIVVLNKKDLIKLKIL